jgi:hypothetical protein
MTVRSAFLCLRDAVWDVAFLEPPAWCDQSRLEEEHPRCEKAVSLIACKAGVNMIKSCHV